MSFLALLARNRLALAGLNPIGVVVAALFIASIFVGADSMSRATGVSNYLADLIVAMSLISVLVSALGYVLFAFSTNTAMVFIVPAAWIGY